MTRTARVPACEPVVDILRQAALLGLVIRSGMLSSSANYLYAACAQSVIRSA